MQLAGLRHEYPDQGLSVTDLTACPMDQFGRWFADIDEAVPKSDTAWFEPNAVVLSTALPTTEGAALPSARTVLLKGFDPQGFTIFTNYHSRKGRELTANPNACLLFPWYPLRRQVIATGPVSRLTEAENDAYFATRPRGAQLGAWSSEQSAPLADRTLLDERYAAYDQRFPDQVPRPAHWGGLRIEPVAVEFWQGRANRMHDRFVYRREATHGAQGVVWQIEQLNP